MKRLIALILAAGLVMPLALGCGGDEKKDKDKTAKDKAVAPKDKAGDKAPAADKKTDK